VRDGFRYTGKRIAAVELRSSVVAVRKMNGITMLRSGIDIAAPQTQRSRFSSDSMHIHATIMSKGVECALSIHAHHSISSARVLGEALRRVGQRTPWDLKEVLSLAVKSPLSKRPTLCRQAPGGAG
jgi:hypothetical protein